MVKKLSEEFSEKILNIYLLVEMAEEQLEKIISDEEFNEAENIYKMGDTKSALKLAVKSLKKAAYERELAVDSFKYISINLTELAEELKKRMESE